MEKKSCFNFFFVVVFTAGMFPASLFAQAIAYYSGNVKNTDNQPIENVLVTALGADSVGTNSSGEFMLQFFSLEPDTITTISFRHPEYLPFDTGIFIIPGDSITNQVIVLEPNPNPETFIVSGNARFEDNQPVQSGVIEIFRVYPSGPVLLNYFAITDNQGNYSIELLAGNYYIRSRATYSQGFAWTYRYSYWDNAPTLEEADLLTLISDTSNINFTHPVLQVGSISGNVIDAVTNLPIQGAEIQFTSNPLIDSTLVGTNENGNYSVNVFEGEYFVLAYKPGYQVQFFDQVLTIFDATPVVVKAPDSLNITGIDFPLDSLGNGTNSISGFVYDSDTGLPLADVYVFAIPLEPGGLVKSAISKGNQESTDEGKLLKTDNNGVYTLGSMENGNYLVLFYKEDYLSIFYNGFFDWENATVLQLTGYTNLTGINAYLEPFDEFGGEILGSVYLSGLTLNTISCALISAYSSSGEVISSTISNYNGEYMLPSLSNGTYTVKASYVGYETTEYPQPVSINLINHPVASGIDIEVDSSLTNIQNESTVAPEHYNLYQNYPNPFNPGTSIQYAISNRQFVSLKVYDVLGNEIVTLVNEEKPAGTYEVTWYAENLPSGVYFYQLKAGDIIQTKKMLLLK